MLFSIDRVSRLTNERRRYYSGEQHEYVLLLVNGLSRCMCACVAFLEVASIASTSYLQENTSQSKDGIPTRTLFLVIGF